MHLRPEYDLNIYHLIGQGWMQGLLPYVHLSDLKGPLVFLLHGLGASLTPGSFLGACLLESFLVGVGILYAYRSARLFMSPLIALGAIGIYSVALWYFSLHPAETVWVLQQVAVYYLLSWGVRGEVPRGGQQLVLGGSAAAVLLLKFNLSVFWGPVCLWAMFAAGRGWWRALLWQVAGALMVLGPFLLYFYAHGALACFWQEYVSVAVQYGETAWATSALATRGWQLAAELVPLHLHQAVPEWLAAMLGWLSLVPSILLPFCLPRHSRWWCGAVLGAAFVLLVLANYMSEHCYIHYSFVFFIYWLAGIIAVAHYARKWILLPAACVLLGGLGFTAGLPLAVMYLKPNNGNAEMRAASAGLAEHISRHAGAELVVLDTQGALHFHRLTGTLPMKPHFIPSMIPGGSEQHRAELAECIRDKKPRYLVGSAACAAQDAAWLQLVAPDCYEARTHAQLGLPFFPEAATRPEYMLYIRR